MIKNYFLEGSLFLPERKFNLISKVILYAIRKIQWNNAGRIQS